MDTSAHKKARLAPTNPRALDGQHGNDGRTFGYEWVRMQVQQGAAMQQCACATTLTLTRARRTPLAPQQATVGHGVGTAAGGAGRGDILDYLKFRGGKVRAQGACRIPLPPK
jgi:hypothetical protein